MQTCSLFGVPTHGRYTFKNIWIDVDKLWTTEIGERKDVAVSTQKFESRWLVGCHRNVSPYLRHNKAKAYLTFSQIESYLRCNYNDKHQQHSAVFFSELPLSNPISIDSFTTMSPVRLTSTDDCGKDNEQLSQSIDINRHAAGVGEKAVGSGFSLPAE